MQRGQNRTGFTIVELLIVVVVIAILAAITIVAYNGIQSRAKESAAKSSLAQAIRKVEAFKSGSPTSVFPTSKTEAGILDSQVTFSPNVTGNAYCVSVLNGAQSYMATNFDKTVRNGDCVNQSGLVVWLPMNGNSSNQGSAGGSDWTVNGATLGIGQNGVSNGSYQFNANTNLSRALPGTFTAMTGSAWVYLDNASGTPGIVSGSGGTNPVHWELSSGNWRVRLGNTDRFGIVASSGVQTWSHVVYTYNRATTTFEYYLDGNRVQSANGDTGQDAYYSTSLILGQSLGSSRQWLGRIDDFRLYDRVLSESEIKTLFSAGAQ